VNHGFTTNTNGTSRSRCFQQVVKKGSQVASDLLEVEQIRVEPGGLVIGAQVAFALTVCGLNAHVGVEGYPLSAWLFAFPSGVLIFELVRLLLSPAMSSARAWTAGV
jgi:hypothetical protein